MEHEQKVCPKCGGENVRTSGNETNKYEAIVHVCGDCATVWGRAVNEIFDEDFQKLLGTRYGNNYAGYSQRLFDAISAGVIRIDRLIEEFGWEISCRSRKSNVK